MIQSLFFQTSWRTQQLGRFLANISCCRIQNTALLKKKNNKIYTYTERMAKFDDGLLRRFHSTTIHS